MTTDLCRIAKFLPPLPANFIRPGMVALASPFGITTAVKWARVFVLTYKRMENVCKVCSICHYSSIITSYIASHNCLPLLRVKKGKYLHFQVLLIDYGLECDALPSKFRELPEYFIKIPPFAHRAHLDFYSEDTPLMPLGFSWAENACQAWNLLMKKLASQNREFYAWSVHQGGNSNGVINLESFNQVTL